MPNLLDFPFWVLLNTVNWLYHFTALNHTVYEFKFEALAHAFPQLC